MPVLLAWLWKWQGIWSNTVKDLLNQILELALVFVITTEVIQNRKKKNLRVPRSVILKASDFQDETFQILPMIRNMRTTKSKGKKRKRIFTLYH